MKPEKPTCESHGVLIQMICADCGELMCCECTGLHSEKSCKAGVMYIPFFATKKLLKELGDTRDNLKSDREEIKKSLRTFAEALPEIVKKLLAVKEMAEKLMADVDKALAGLEGYGPKSADTAYITMIKAIEGQIKSLPSAAKEKNIGQIIKAINTVKNSKGDRGMWRAESTITSVNKILLNAEEFARLGEYLRGLVETCQNVLQKMPVEVIKNSESESDYNC